MKKAGKSMMICNSMTVGPPFMTNGSQSQALESHREQQEPNQRKFFLQNQRKKLF